LTPKLYRGSVSKSLASDLDAAACGRESGHNTAPPLEDVMLTVARALAKLPVALVPAGFRVQPVKADDVLGPNHPEDVRSALRDARRIQRVTKQLPKLADDKPLSGPDAAGILELVWGQVDEEVEAEEVKLPEAIPEWASPDEYMAEWDGWTVSLVRACISAIASAVKEDQEELIEAATQRARLEIISAKAAAERVEQELARMSRERLLPDEKTLEKVARYEAHLSRLFHKALHELEALQIRRSGGISPLARLDVDGLAES
jgi:hypothetical protein